MASYAFSDVHGHLAALDRLLERVSPSSADRIYMLGDMIDRGPDPVGVMQLCRGLPRSVVLMGNHEDLMLSFLRDQSDPVVRLNWECNGGTSTADGLRAMDDLKRIELLDWIASLPSYAHAFVGERPYILVHAGIATTGLAPAETWTDDALEQLLATQRRDDLLWIRDEFWGQPTHLLNERGEGPVVVAGHTPSLYLPGMADRMGRMPLGDDGRCRIVRVGACAATCMVADRWDIDSGAASGAGMGQVSMLRLDDGAEFYEPVREGE